MLDSFYYEDVVTIHYKNGDAKRIPCTLDVGDRFIECTNDSGTEVYLIRDNKIFYIRKKEIGSIRAIRFDELNDIDELCLMSGCINIKDKVYDIVEEESVWLYAKELDLA